MVSNNSPQLIPILSQMNPVHTSPPYVPQIHFNIILQSVPMPTPTMVPENLSQMSGEYSHEKMFVLTNEQFIPFHYNEVINPMEQNPSCS